MVEQIFPIQGTDGVRGYIGESSPQKALEDFKDKQVLSPIFTEVYCYTFCKLLIELNLTSINNSIVLGKDTRDPLDVYTKAAERGIQAAGLTVDYIGALPTPAVVISMQRWGCSGAIMLTALKTYLQRITLYLVGPLDYETPST